VVTDDLGRCLGLVWSSAESLELAVEERRGIYQSRSRGVWRKGETSGSIQELLAVALDCDRDAIRITVRQGGEGFCHTGSWSCFGGDQGWGALNRRLRDRISTGDPESYTRSLLDRRDLLKGKLLEEAAELADATEPREVLHEAADLLYFASVALARGGVDPAGVLAELDRRGVTTRRRPASIPEGIEP
jgi:phosphoribosyl-ATP pyrophosphohydrolase